MKKANHAWAARVLNVPENLHEGPDLIDDRRVVELKFKLMDAESRKWTVLDYQLEYNKLRGRAYWGLGKYLLDRDVSEVRTTNLEGLESMVRKRLIYIVSWDWMLQFPVRMSKGRTESSEWDNRLVYAKEDYIPKVSKEYNVEKGLVFLTEGVPESDFSILR